MAVNIDFSDNVDGKMIVCDEEFVPAKVDGVSDSPVEVGKYDLVYDPREEGIK